MKRRQDSHKKVRLGMKWRRPRGWQNKVRLGKKGYVSKTKIGERTPVAERHMHEGREIFRVENLSQLNEAKDKAIILGKIGMKKEMMILEEALKQNMKFTFDAKERLAALKKKHEEKKIATESAAKEKEAKQKQAEKAAAAAKKGKEVEEKEDVSEEEKKKKLDKELIKRQ